MKATRSRSKRPRPYRKSGFHALVKAASRAGLSAPDGRSTQARALKVWKAQVAADLGDDLSAQQRTLLDVAAVDMALLSVADAWLKEHAGEVVNKRKRTFVPLVLERLRVASHLAVSNLSLYPGISRSSTASSSSGGERLLGQGVDRQKDAAATSEGAEEMAVHWGSLRERLAGWRDGRCDGCGGVT